MHFVLVLAGGVPDFNEPQSDSDEVDDVKFSGTSKYETPQIASSSPNIPSIIDCNSMAMRTNYQNVDTSGQSLENMRTKMILLPGQSLKTMMQKTKVTSMI